MNLCRLHNFFPGTPHPSMLFFRSGALDPLTGLQLLGAFGANELFVEKCINASLRMCFNQWYQCHSMATHSTLSLCQQRVRIRVIREFHVFHLLPLRSGRNRGGGKIQIRPDPQKFSALRGPKIRIFSSVQRHRREIFGIWML